MKNNERDFLQVILTGEFAAAVKTGAESDLLDTRWTPLLSSETNSADSLFVDRWYAPRSFFERMERQWVDAHWFAARFPRIHSATPQAFSANINTWLAIVDKYGLRADYDQEFLLTMQQIIVEILIYAYRVDDSGRYDTLRKFNGLIWGQSEFHQHFSRFILNRRLLTSPEYA
jgi:hypothetical protein